MASLRFFLLGQPQVFCEQAPVEPSTYFDKLILYYLAVRGCLFHQEELERVFTDVNTSSPDETMANLARLQHALPDKELVVVEDGLVGLNVERTYIDHLHFRDLLDRVGRVPWQIPRDQPLPSQTLNLLTQAIDLWRGERFLEGVDFLDIPQVEQEVKKTARGLLKLKASVLGRLADHYYIKGDFLAAEEILCAALKMNNPSDYLYELRMKVFIDQGHLSQAREYYQKVTKVMRANGRIGPPPSLIALYQEIKGNTHVDVPEPRPAWDIHPCVHVPLVGRETILNQLALARKQDKNILLLGETGQGKTRITKEYADSVSAWHNVLNVNCKPNEIDLPYQPFISLFRHQIPPNIWLNLSPLWAKALSSLLPEITMMRTDLNGEAASPLSSSVLMEAIRQTFKLLATSKPLLLVFEDLQHADSSTLQTFTYLLDRYPFNNGNGMLVGTLRESETSSRHHELMNVFYDAKHSDLLRLRGLSLAAISKLTYHVLQESPSRHFVRTLSEESGGNPLFILELLRSILDTGRKPDLSSKSEFPLNEKLSSFIRNRLVELAPMTYRVLEAAAVLGTEFDVSLLPLVAKIEEEESLQAVEFLSRKNLIVEQEGVGTSPIKYRFVNNKIREVLLAEMSPARRLLLHNQAARIKVDEGAKAAIIASHYEKAQNYPPAFYYWVKAGESARALASAGEATRAFQRAESLLNEHHLTPSRAHLYRFFSTWNSIAFETHDIALVERLNDTLLEIGKERGDDWLIGTAWGNLSDACMARDEFKIGLKYVNRALNFLDEKRHVTEYVENMVRKGIFLNMLNRLGKAEEVFQDALSIGRESEESQETFNALANAHIQLGLAAILQLHPRRGLKHAKFCLEYASKGHHPHRQLASYVYIAFSHYLLGNYNQGRTALQKGFELAERIQGWRMRGQLHLYHSMIDLAEGKLEAALEHARQTYQIGERFAYHDSLALGRRAEGDIYRILQAYDEAQESYSSGYESTSEIFIRFENLYRLGLVLAHAGEIKRGKELVKEGIEKMEAASFKLGVTMALLALESVALLEDDLEEAMRLNTRIDKMAQGSSCALYRLANRILLGKIALKEGKVAQAEKFFQSVAQEAANLPNVWVELEAQLGWEKCSQALGQETSPQEDRITHLLDAIQANLTGESLRPHYQTFRQRVLDREMNAILYI